MHQHRHADLTAVRDFPIVPLSGKQENDPEKWPIIGAEGCAEPDKVKEGLGPESRRYSYF
jgi:hypothetical protein